jgi:DNA-directed RNA polymerase subunit RPC12/RpoP
MTFIYGGNFQNTPIKIKHAELKRMHNSKYKSECPACEKGILLMMRNKDSTLSSKDNCTACGQPFIYTDIKPDTYS